MARLTRLGRVRTELSRLRITPFLSFHVYYPFATNLESSTTFGNEAWESPGLSLDPQFVPSRRNIRVRAHVYTGSRQYKTRAFY